MKKILRTLFLIVSVAILPVSCGKDPYGGGMGPSGNGPGGGGTDAPPYTVPADLPEGITFDPASPDADANLVVRFKAPESSPLYGYKGEVYAHLGIVDGSVWNCVPADWDENIPKCRMTPAGENIWIIQLYPSVREWFASGTLPVKNVGVVIRSADGTKKGVEEDTFCAVNDSKYNFYDGPIENAPVPAGCLPGINIGGDKSVTLVLQDKDKNGNRKDFAFVLGEFNSWSQNTDYLMKRDDNAGCWWITLEGLDPDKEHMFQYYIGSQESGGLRIADPYSEIVYSQDDKYILKQTYPDLPEFPATSGYVSSFKINSDEYNWKYPDFEIQDDNNLIIYELHLRDFTSPDGITSEEHEVGNLQGALEKLDYLQALGVNAIELMPVQEFDGNDSWGYNPSYFFALDKAYGTREQYKKFIDECHARGIAVLFDVVYNHATGANAMAALYWDAANNKTAPENPWFNVDAPHPYSVFHDFNHESELVRTFVKRNLEFLLTEYNIDGFRFDLTKGFTNNQSNESTASRYDASRVAILSDYASAVHSVTPDAVVILEHFCDLQEENELARNGMKLWRNLNNAFSQTAMGYLTDSSFEGLWTGTSMPYGSLVGFMESHDEERNAYKSKTFAPAAIKNSLETRMKRAEANAAFFLLVPGPKMIWQMGELGYDYSIEFNGRSGRKPVMWSYYDDEYRKKLYDRFSEILDIRSAYPEFFSESAAFKWTQAVDVISQNTNNARSFYITSGGKGLVVMGNFSQEKRELWAETPFSGTWKNLLESGEEFNTTNNWIGVLLDPGDVKVLFYGN